MDGTKILLTGGHAATTGIAVIQEIKKQRSNAEIYWIGSKLAIAGSRVATLEHKIYPSMGVKYFEIKSGKLQTKFTRYTIPLALMIPLGFFQALGLVLKISPKVILSFGGSASFPVVFWGWMLGIPVVLHEQTVVAGRAALVSSYFVRKVALGREESEKHFPKKKIVVTGNPLMKEILSLKPKTRISSDKTILVMGGSRGSEFINEEFIKIVPRLTTDHKIIHITGDRDYDKYKSLQNKNYTVVSSVNPHEMCKMYERADAVVSRSGANSVSEILYLKIPSVLIPLPRTFMNEQLKNAEYAAQAGIAKVMTESEVNPDSLYGSIQDIFSEWNTIVRKASSYESPDKEAAAKLSELILEYA